VDGDGGVAEHGFGTSGGDDDFALAVYAWIGNIPEGAFFFFVIDFDVSEGGLMLGTVIDKLFTSVNEAVLPESLEGIVDGVDDLLVESEDLGRPVAGSAEGAKLKLHVPSLFGDEIPSLLVELVAGEVEAGFALLLEDFLVNYPGLEAGMVGAGDPPGGMALETVVPDKDVFTSGEESVADMEVAVGVGRRHNDGIRAFFCILFGLEGVGALPEGIDLGFEIAGYVRFGEFHDVIISSGDGIANSSDRVFLAQLADKHAVPRETSPRKHMFICTGSDQLSSELTIPSPGTTIDKMLLLCYNRSN